MGSVTKDLVKLKNLWGGDKSFQEMCNEIEGIRDYMWEWTYE